MRGVKYFFSLQLDFIKTRRMKMSEVREDIGMADRRDALGAFSKLVKKGDLDMTGMKLIINVLNDLLYEIDLELVLALVQEENKKQGE